MKNILFILLVFLSLSGFSQLPNYNVTINTTDKWDGNIFFLLGGSPQKPVKIIDTSGVTIFHENWHPKGWDFKVNYNNKLSYYDRGSRGWFIMDSLQNEIDSVYCQNGYEADNHDFIALPNGNYILFAYDQQPYAMDTVVPGGNPNAIVEGLIIQELDPSHNVIFEWKSWDHFHVTDNIYYAPWTDPQLNFIHANAIDVDFDGNLIFSSRGLDEITKIDRTSGDIIWRFGGSNNDFTFINDYPFTHQHSIKSLGNNRYLLYDNGNYSSQHTGTSNFSRAVEYELDTIAMTAEKVWEFVHPDSLYTPSIGGVQRLPNGNTLITFGNLQASNIGSIITEVDSGGNIVYQLEYDDGGNIYRAQKYDWFFFTPVPGCTDSLACNFDFSANIDDGSCCYELPPLAITILECDSVTYEGTTYTTSAMHTFTGVNSCGCDSVVHTQININYSSYSYDTLVTNGVILWNGSYLASSGDYSATLINSLDCDSIVNLNLTVTTTNIINIYDNADKQIVKTVDVLGKKTKENNNKILFIIFDDGTIEKKIIIGL